MLFFLETPMQHAIICTYLGKDSYTMSFWIILLSALALLGLASVFYLVTRFRRFRFMRVLAVRHNGLAWFLSAAAVGLFFLFGLINVYAVVIAILHLAVIWILCDLAAFIIGKIRKKKSERYIAGTVALIITAVYLTAGWIAAHHVWETDYKLSSSKIDESLRIALIADSHLSITLDGEDFAGEMKKIQAANPDIVVIVGDYVDDDTREEDMEIACRALGELKTKYGVYYVFGNHDKGYYRARGFNESDLRNALESNGVVILEDESVALGDDYMLIGRKDRSTPNRLPAADLTADADPGKYTIILDHQPNDYAAEAAAGADLVLSGHTHGGHIFPAGPIGMLMKANDMIYGLKQQDNTSFIVTSGISGWAIPFKTGTRSEYVIIDINRAD